MAVFYLAIGLANLTKGPHGLLIPLLAVLVFLASSHDLAFVRRMGLLWGLPLSLVPFGFWVAAYRGTGEAFPLEALLQRLTHRFTSGEHHAQPFYHVLISLPLEFFPWIILLPAALRLTFPRPGARPDRDNAYVYSWAIVIFSVFAVSVEKRGVYLLPLLPLLALLVARLWDLALMGWDPSPVDRAIAWLPGTCLALAIVGAAVALPKIRSQAPDLLRPAVFVAVAAGLAALLALIVYRRYKGGAALAAFCGGVVNRLPGRGRHGPAGARSAQIGARLQPSRPRRRRQNALAMYPDYHPTYVYYTGRFIPVLRNSRQLGEYFNSPDLRYCLIEDDVFEAERRASSSP